MLTLNLKMYSLGFQKQRKKLFFNKHAFELLQCYVKKEERQKRDFYIFIPVKILQHKDHDIPCF